MKKVRSLLCVCLALLLCACGKAGFSAPFSEDIKWSMSEAEVKKALGEPADSYLSVYGGNCLSYPLEYMDREGTLKLMFDADGALASTAWAYVTADPADFEALSAAISEAETKLHGSTSLDPAGKGASGSVWYTDEGDILTASVAVGGQYGFQYSYIEKNHSGR